MLWELMGICFSCRRPTGSRLNNKISEHISASVTPLHVCLEEQRGPELGSCDASAYKPQVNLIIFIIEYNINRKKKNNNFLFRQKSYLKSRKQKKGVVKKKWKLKLLQSKQEIWNSVSQVCPILSVIWRWPTVLKEWWANVVGVSQKMVLILISHVSFFYNFLYWNICKYIHRWHIIYNFLIMLINVYI